MAGELLRALRAVDGTTPAEIEHFDRVVASASPWPDFHEHSLRLPDVASCYRLTDYFDVHRHGASVAREAGERFVSLCTQLGLDLPRALSEFVRSEARAGDEVLQVVLGIEVPARSGALRGKYYLVFRDDPAVCVTALAGALGLALPSGVDPARVYILGVDVTQGGVDDLKLYFRLPPAQVPRLVENLPDVEELLADSREIVFQQCLRRPERRQMYLHARSAPRLSDWLARRGFEAALARWRSIAAHLPDARLEPWIVAFPYEQRRLRLQAGTVYFHVLPAA